MSKKIEKERKWLLKMPSAQQPDEMIAMWQFYADKRLRFQTQLRRAKYGGFECPDWIMREIGLHHLFMAWQNIGKKYALKVPGHGEWVSNEKLKIAKGEFDETEELLQNLFEPLPAQVAEAEFAISKLRHNYYHSNRKWEMDVMGDGLRLCFLEMEMDEKEDINDPQHIVDMPEHLRSLVVKEVTGDNLFSNRAISIENPFRRLTRL